MIDAKTARKIADVCVESNELTAKFILEAMTEISSAACSGKSSVKMGTGTGHNHESISQALANLGYNVQWTPQSVAGWHHVSISW